MTTSPDPRIGYGTQMPAQTVSGAPTPTHYAPSTRGLGGDYFVVLDAFTSPGFDVEAAISELGSLLNALPPEEDNESP